MKHLVFLIISFAIPYFIGKLTDAMFIARLGDLFARLINKDVDSVTISDPILLGQAIIGILILIILELKFRKKN